MSGYNVSADDSGPAWGHSLQLSATMTSPKDSTPYLEEPFRIQAQSTVPTAPADASELAGSPTGLPTDGDDTFPTVARESLSPEDLANMDLLVACIDADAERTGRTRSAQRFAREYLARDPRTIRRWLAGEWAIPAVVVDWLHGYLTPAPAAQPASGAHKDHGEGWEG